MRLSISKSKNSTLFYAIKSTYINKKHSTKIVEKLGTLEEVCLKARGQDPYVWAKKYIEQLTVQEKKGQRQVIKKYSPTKMIDKNQQVKFNGGYLFLQDLYYKLGIHNICDQITDKYKFKYDLNNILSRLIYSRIIYPSSKLKTLELSKNFIEQPTFDLHHVYRALEVISKESDFIQSELYKNSCKYSKRNDKILYYDCTNYFFEVEEESGLKQYGKSKENRPLPIVQMGLFLDGDGIPLTFDITPGNTNEQVTLKPLEEKIIKDFKSSKFVVCTDAGLASTSNRKFNNTNNRCFITTQSIKKLKNFLKEDALDLTKGWKLLGSDKVYDISKIREDDDLIQKFRNKIFYKERWIKENNLEQRLIITYSVKYQEYQKRIRENQINRAKKLMDTNPKSIGKPKQNDMKRFINSTPTTEAGEVATQKHYNINEELILEESKYDGLYAVCTNLEDDVMDIININRNRWEIEESFRIMKSEFKARPVYLSRDDRIKAHFTTCFLALVIYRYLEKKLDEKYTVTELIKTLREMEFIKEAEEGFIPIYTRNNKTDALHNKFGFRTDYEIVTNRNIKKIYKQTKS